MMGSFHEEKTVEDFHTPANRIRHQMDKQYRDYLLGQLYANESAANSHADYDSWNDTCATHE